jgi:hypothetical protein
VSEAAPLPAAAAGEWAEGDNRLDGAHDGGKESRASSSIGFRLGLVRSVESVVGGEVVSGLDCGRGG